MLRLWPAPPGPTALGPPSLGSSIAGGAESMSLVPMGGFALASEGGVPGMASSDP